MWYLDEPLVESFTKIIGKKPEFYFFGLESWSLVFVPAAHTNVATGTGRMIAWSGNKLYMMETSQLTTAKWFPDKLKIIEFKDIKRARRTRFFFAHFLQIEMKNGDLLRLVVNPWLYLRLHGQREGIRLFEEALAQKPWDK